VLCLVIAFAIFHSGFSAIHNLNVDEDERRYFLIESFGFLQGGMINITVNNFVRETSVRSLCLILCD